MSEKDYYNVLGVDRGASQDEIKKAFRKKAHQFHPDKPNGDEAKFKEANEAYQVLGDEQKRQQYDQFGSSAFDGSGGFGYGGGQGFGGFQGNINVEDLGDMFGDMFGFGGGGRRARRGSDIHMDIDMSFKESVFGMEKEIELRKPSDCARCGGLGAEPGTNMHSCGDCDGSGVKVVRMQTVLGVMQQKTSCSACKGEGETPETQCSDCSGSGITMQTKKMTVSIPAGIENGNIVRIRGEGEAIQGGETGDLFLRVHVASDERFERVGFDLLSHAKVGFSQAALGDKIDVETIDGVVELKIPSGTQSGTKMRLKGKGIAGKGDQIVIIDVITPKKLSRSQKKLLEELDLKE